MNRHVEPPREILVNRRTSALAGAVGISIVRGMSPRLLRLFACIAAAPLIAGASAPADAKSAGTPAPAEPVPPAARVSPAAVVVPEKPISPAKPAESAPEKPASTAPDPRGFLFETTPAGWTALDYSKAVDALLAAYERDTQRKLVPGPLKKVGIKLYTSSGLGLATPAALTDAVIAAMERRGFPRSGILLVDQQEKRLRETGYLPVLASTDKKDYKGCPVLALDSGRYFDPRWTYPSSLPSKDFPLETMDFSAAAIERERKSPLPMPLLFEVDFWINLPMVCDSSAVGVSGALANATLLNIGNWKRFLENASNAQQTMVDIAAIPEFKDKFELTILTLESYQIAGGAKFDAAFTLSEPSIWLSANPIILDYLMWKRINAGRDALNRRSGSNMRLIDPEPVWFLSANTGDERIRLGSCRPSDLKLVRVEP